MYEFVMGMAAGYILHPVTLIIADMIKDAWHSRKGCTGNCNQGRCPCNCMGKQNGIS